MNKCKIKGCKNKHYAKGYCQKHYKRYKKFIKKFESLKFTLNDSIVKDNIKLKREI